MKKMWKRRMKKIFDFPIRRCAGRLVTLHYITLLYCTLLYSTVLYGTLMYSTDSTVLKCTVLVVKYYAWIQKNIKNSSCFRQKNEKNGKEHKYFVVLPIVDNVANVQQNRKNEISPCFEANEQKIRSKVRNEPSKIKKKKNNRKRKKNRKEKEKFLFSSWKRNV